MRKGENVKRVPQSKVFKTYLWLIKAVLLLREPLVWNGKSLKTRVKERPVRKWSHDGKVDYIPGGLDMPKVITLQVSIRSIMVLLLIFIYFFSFAVVTPFGIFLKIDVMQSKFQRNSDNMEWLQTHMFWRGALTSGNEIISVNRCFCASFENCELFSEAKMTEEVLMMYQKWNWLKFSWAIILY